MKGFLFALISMTMMQKSTLSLAEFSDKSEIADWYVVDDGVMGGLSQGTISLNDAGNALFSGTVRLENNGGFSSIRRTIEQENVTEFSAVHLKVKGDGKAYQFRIKSDRSQRFSYINSFTTSGEWETISLQLGDFYPSFRGNTLDRPNFPGKHISEIAILIGNKKKESFSLEIEKIYLK